MDHVDTGDGSCVHKASDRYVKTQTLVETRHQTTDFSDWTTTLALAQSSLCERKGELSPKTTRPKVVKALGRFAGVRLFALRMTL